MYYSGSNAGVLVLPLRGAQYTPWVSECGLAGLGLDNSTKQIVLSAPSIVGGILTAGGTVATAGGGTTSIAAAAWGAAAVPIIGAAVAGVTIGLMLLFNRKGPRQKVATTAVVDAVEPKLQANLEGFLNGPRTPESKAQALANFDAGWQWVLDNCDIPEMGNPGKACVADRQPGGKWDWFALYRDPIAAAIADSPAPAAGAFSFGGGESKAPWLLLAAAGLLAVGASL